MVDSVLMLHPVTGLTEREGRAGGRWSKRHLSGHLKPFGMFLTAFHYYKGSCNFLTFVNGLDGD